MIFVVAAVVWGAACASLAWRYPRGAQRTARQPFVTSLERELAVARSDAERVATTNELLADVERGLRERASAPKLAGWLAVTGVGLILVAGVLADPRPVILVAASGGAIGVAGAVAARRIGDRFARRARARADRTASSLVGELYDAEIVLPERSRRRFRSKTR